VKIACAQMDMRLGESEYNFAHAEKLLRKAADEGADVILLPETWNLGFFPREGLAELADPEGGQVKKTFGSLARELNVNIVAGSAVTVRDGSVFNTACVFDRAGDCIASYDKTHLFTPMGEHEYFTPGDHLCTFTLDGVKCGLIICYDLRFPELTRSLTLAGAELLFVPAQWPAIRRTHWQTLNRARAIENQIFLACCNSCGRAGETVYGGSSAIYDPWGNILAEAGAGEEIISADCDFSIKEQIRNSINVFRDRRPEIYHV
jgi:predicted amidohydrolase